MTTTVTAEPNPAPPGEHRARRHAKLVKRSWLSVLTLAIIGVVTGALVVFSWMIDETHFDRPSPDFDAFEAKVADLPSVDTVDIERWVEAPTFSNPTSWMSVTVEDDGLALLLQTACSTDYPDPVTWSIRVRTPAASEVSLFAGPTAPNDPDGDVNCPNFGFDAVQLVDELDRTAPGLAIQPAIWQNGRFALVVLEEHPPSGFTHLLPLVEQSDDLLAAAGLEPNSVVEVNSASLGLVLDPGESNEYLALLTDLSENYAVSNYWADRGAQADGTDKVQIIAPGEHHTAIEQIIHSSQLSVAKLPVRFIGR